MVDGVTAIYDGHFFFTKTGGTTYYREIALEGTRRSPRWMCPRGGFPRNRMWQQGGMKQRGPLWSSWLCSKLEILQKMRDPYNSAQNTQWESTIFSGDSTDFFRSRVFLIFLEIEKKRVFRLGCAP